MRPPVILASTGSNAWLQHAPCTSCQVQDVHGGRTNQPYICNRSDAPAPAGARGASGPRTPGFWAGFARQCRAHRPKSNSGRGAAPPDHPTSPERLRIFPQRPASPAAAWDCFRLFTNYLHKMQIICEQALASSVLPAAKRVLHWVI
jgi:hypothetical protein